MARQMYLECTLGSVNPDWKLDKPLEGTQFRNRMGEQLCKHRASNQCYPGDQFLRRTTQLNKKQRHHRRKAVNDLQRGDNGMLIVSYNNYLDAKNPRGRDSVTRLCSDDLAQLRTHLNSVYRCDRIICQVCGRITWTKCGIYNLACCFRSDRNDQTSLSCCIDLHDDNFLGLTRDDKTNLFGTKKGFQKGNKD